MGNRVKRERLPVRFWRALFPRKSSTVSPARDLAVEAQEFADIQGQIVKQGLSYLPLVGLLVIALNILIQVRGNVGLAIAVAQNLSFGALAVTVLLNLIFVFSLGLIFGLLPVVFDKGYNPKIRSGAISAYLITLAVMLFTIPWIMWLGVVGLSLLLNYVTWRLNRTGTRTASSTSWEGLLRGNAPEDVVLRRTWANGRSMLRAIGQNDVPVTPLETAMMPPPSPELLKDLVAKWNERQAVIAGPTRKSVTTLFYSGIVSFIAIYGFMIVSQPIKFAPLERISINASDADVGYLLMPSDRGIFISKDASTFRYVSSEDQIERNMCQVARGVWTANVFQLFAKSSPDEVDCASEQP